MALHLNLYHEVQKARKLKRRDPLKISMYGLAALAAGFASYYFVELGRMHGIAAELNKVQAEYNSLEPKAKTAKKREDEIALEVRKSELMERRIEDRFYWAPMLEEIAKTVPKEVQVTRLVGDLTGDGIRKCSITVDGISAGPDPRKVAEDLRTAIADKLAPKYKNVTSNFKTLEDGTETVMLEGQQMATATFAINVQITAGDDVKPAAPARNKKR